MGNSSLKGKEVTIFNAMALVEGPWLHVDYSLRNERRWIVVIYVPYHSVYIIHTSSYLLSVACSAYKA